MFDINNLRVNFESKVLASSRVVLVPHKTADFDAIGSAIGLSLAVSKLKKASVIIVDDKAYELDRGVYSIIKDSRSEHNIMTKAKYLSTITSNDGSTNDLFVMTDVNKSYLVTVADLMKDPENVMIIDHHEGDDKTVDSNYQFIDSKVSSASEIVVKLLQKMKVKIPKNIANYLLAGIYLDTNKLTKNVSAETLLIASKLVEFGADTNFVMELFTEDYDSDRRVQELVNRTRMIQYKIAMVLADAGNEYTTKELARTADYGLNYGVDASFAVGKISEDIVAVSARSKSTIDVGKVMQQMGGGGNQFSAATKIEGQSIEEVGKKLELILRPNCYVEKKTES
jgi:c-di-AMP phosphodiesterase-like protein